MRIFWAAPVVCGWGLILPAPAFAAAPAPNILPLTECRLEHPLRLASMTARCGTLAVAEDRSDPKGAKIYLQIAVIPALNRRAHSAPLFLLAGGPGQGAIDMYVNLAGAFARINREHDLVLLDQRGTGKSAPLDCKYPDDWLQAADALSALRAATRECLQKFGARVQNYTSSIAVRDLDEARRALGYAAIDLYGASYGTRVAELYMRRYPAFVHAVILDGVIYPEQPLGLATPLDGEHALALIVARCRESRDCAQAYPRLQQDLELLRQRFGAELLPVTIDDPSSGLPRPIVFNRGLLSAALRFLSYSASEASLLPELLHQAALGHVAPLAAQAVMIAEQIGGQLASGMQNTVVCSEDVPLFEGSIVDRARLARTYQGTDQIDGLMEVCKLWPKGPVDEDLHAPLISSIPSLLLSGEADPVTPPADAERTALGLRRHRHLVLAGEGHGQLATGCMPRLMAEFLDKADPQKLDAGCLAQHRATPFFVSMAGPSP
jgi:pimeloyl-ACP methyl ester carboxylesterase